METFRAKLGTIPTTTSLSCNPGPPREHARSRRDAPLLLGAGYTLSIDHASPNAPHFRSREAARRRLDRR